jgi:hypothetical protein
MNSKQAVVAATMMLVAGCGGHVEQVSPTEASLIAQAPIGFDVTHVRPMPNVLAAVSVSNQASYNNPVQQLYIAYFGRPADRDGLLFTEGLLSTWGIAADLQGLIGAYNTDARVKLLVDSFATSAESKALYTGTTGGLSFWAGAIDSGSLTRSGAALGIMAGAQTTDISTIASKTAVATAFTSLITDPNQYDSMTAAAQARAMLAGVDYTTDVIKFQPTVQATWKATSASYAIPPSSVSVADYLTKDITPALSFVGIWDPIGVAGTALIDFWNVARLGPDQRQGVVLAGWAYSGFTNTAADVTPVKVAVLAQQADGTLKLVTDQLLPSPVTNGAGSVIIADFNGDGKDDIFLAAHNESPFVAKASTAYLSKQDGTFEKATLPDTVMDHHASLAYINGKPTVLGASFNQKMANPIYTYNGNGNFDVNNSSGFVGAMSVAAADFLGDGKTQIVYGDASWGFNLQYSDTKPMQQYIYSYADGKLIGNPAGLPAPYFNDKPQYSQFDSNYGVSKTHNSRLWVDDVNQDGKPDIIVGGEIWSAGAGLQKTILQILVNGGNLKFSDQTDTLNPQYNQDAYYDYSLRMADIDQSGIKTYFGAQQSQSTLVGTAYVPQKQRHGNYILVNDGSGRFHVAMHDEFMKMGDYVNQYVAAQLKGSNYLAKADNDTPRFIAYQTSSGAINFLASVAVSENVNGSWVSKFALVNVPLNINLAAQYKENIIIASRNGSHNIRTYAGDDVIHAASDGQYCSIDGGGGVNTLVYPGKRSNYTVASTNLGYTVKDNVGMGGLDTLKRIQILKFADATLTLN